MRIEYIRFLKKKPEKMMMKHLRNEEHVMEKRRARRGYHAKKMAFKFNKNRVALVAISLMLVTASYWNYLNKTKLKIAQIGDATFVNSNAVIEELENIENSNYDGDINSIGETNANEFNNENQDLSEVSDDGINQDGNVQENGDNSKEDSEKNSDVREVSAEDGSEKRDNEGSDDEKNYFAKIKLDREKMFSQMIDSYKSILENSNIDDEQKKVASEEVKNINNRQNAITTIENLLKGKGFSDTAVLINDNSINVIVKSNEGLKDEQVAQIENIVSRELNENIEKIHISTHK